MKITITSADISAIIDDSARRPERRTISRDLSGDVLDLICEALYAVNRIGGTWAFNIDRMKEFIPELVGLVDSFGPSAAYTWDNYFEDEALQEVFFEASDVLLKTALAPATR